ASKPSWRDVGTRPIATCTGCRPATGRRISCYNTSRPTTECLPPTGMASFVCRGNNRQPNNHRYRAPTVGEERFQVLRRRVAGALFELLLLSAFTAPVNASWGHERRGEWPA